MTLHGLLLGLILGAPQSPAPFQADGNNAPSDVFTTRHREMRIPVEYSPNSPDRIKGVRLWFSTDEGKTWQKHLDLPTGVDHFSFTAKDDGLYWFFVEGLPKWRDPAAAQNPPQPPRIPDLKILVRSNPNEQGPPPLAMVAKGGQLNLPPVPDNVKAAGDLAKARQMLQGIAQTYADTEAGATAKEMLRVFEEQADAAKKAAKANKPQQDVLAITIEAPANAKVGEDVTLVVVIRNRGDAALKKVLLRATLGQGLEHEAGSFIEADVVDLKAGESRRVTLQVTARKTGRLTASMVAEAAEQARSQAECAIAVIQRPADPVPAPVPLAPG